MESIGRLAKANTSRAANMAQRDHDGTQCIIRNMEDSAFILSVTGLRQARRYERAWIE